ncbi:MAG: hypothetical protein QOF42_2453, partial [Gammaproteobacteria bacterium]|nr:hypothetical protein [Gammaproteobacteria bacterium]
MIAHDSTKRSSINFLLAWHLLGFALLLLLPGIKAHVAFWVADSPVYAANILACAYLAGVAILLCIRAVAGPVGAATAIVVMIAALGAGCLSFLLHKPVPDVPRSVIAAMFAAAVVLAAIGFALRRFTAAALIVLTLIVGAVGALQLYRVYGPVKLKTQVIAANLSSAFYSL